MPGILRSGHASTGLQGLVVLTCLALSLSACRPSIRMDQAGKASTIDESDKIPAKAFFGNPLFSHVKLSPNGRRIRAFGRDWK